MGVQARKQRGSIGYITYYIIPNRRQFSRRTGRLVSVPGYCMFVYCASNGGI